MKHYGRKSIGRSQIQTTSPKVNIKKKLVPEIITRFKNENDIIHTV